MEILGGTTVIPTRMVSVFDRDGQGLTPRDLADRPDLRRPAGSLLTSAIKLVNVAIFRPPLERCHHARKRHVQRHRGL